MRFLYLIQTESDTPENFKGLERRAAQDPSIDFVKLTFKEQLPGALYLPNSTWTEGRNALVQYALSLDAHYDYYIFCDDDVVVEAGSWEAFERGLETFQPALATPFHPCRRPLIDDVIAHQTYDIDAMVNAFHRDVLLDQVLMPYYPGFDTKSWWISQLFVIHVAAILYPGYVLMINALQVSNRMHRDYPRLESNAENWAVFEEWIFANIVVDNEYTRSLFRNHYTAEYLPVGPPLTPRRSYRLSESERRLLRYPS